MNTKKIAMLVALIGMSGFFLAACGSKNADNQEVIDGKQVDFKKDAVDQKTKTVDGKEVTKGKERFQLCRTSWSRLLS